MDEEENQAVQQLIGAMQKASNLAIECVVKSTMAALNGETKKYPTFEDYLKGEEEATNALIEKNFPDEGGRGWFWFFYGAVGEQIAKSAVEFVAMSMKGKSN